jgi:hypothetical protein
MQMESLSEDTGLEGVSALLLDTASLFKVLDQDLTKFKGEVAIPSDNMEGREDYDNELIPSGNMEGRGDNDYDNELIPSDNMEGREDYEFDFEQLEDIATEENYVNEQHPESEAQNHIKPPGKEVKSLILLMKNQFSMQIDLMSKIKHPFAKKSIAFLQKALGFMSSLEARKVRTFDQMREEEIEEIPTLSDEAEQLAQEAANLLDDDDVSKGFSFKAGDHKTGAEAEKHLENLSNRHKLVRQIDTLAVKMSNSLQDILAKEMRHMDLKESIKYLTTIAKHLTFLKQQWAELRTFFEKLGHLLKITERDIRMMHAYYTDIGTHFKGRPLSASLKELLLKTTVNGMAYNIFVIQVSGFYTKLTDSGLLKKLNLLGLNLKKVKNERILKRYKKYILDDAKKVQNDIKVAVGRVDSILNNKITKQVAAVKNSLLCAFEDQESLEGKANIAMVQYELLGKVNDVTNVVKTTNEAELTDLENDGIITEENTPALVAMDKELDDILGSMFN